MATNQLTNLLPSLTSPIASVEMSINGQNISGKAFLIPPWNSFFQQFVQDPPAVIDIDVTASPFSITPNAIGVLSVIGGTISSVVLTRGSTSISLPPSSAWGIIPIRMKDTVTVTYTVKPTIRFLPN